MNNKQISRREFGSQVLGTAAAAAIAGRLSAQDNTSETFRPRYILGSPMYGYTKLEGILPEVAKVDAQAIDIWPKVHGDQREQIDQMGHDRFRALLEQHQVSFGCLTHYKLGPFGLQDEMRFAAQFGCRTMVTGGKGPKELTGGELKAAVADFVEKMKPHLAVAEETGITIGIENHANNLIESPDSLKWLAELTPSPHLGIAFAPYHLPQDADMLAELIRQLGKSIVMFYAWQHGMGCTTKLPKEQELLQMPGRGELDFTPLLAALRDIKYTGWTEIFMHPVPRGIPILEPTAAVTDEINRSRSYLTNCLARI